MGLRQLTASLLSLVLGTSVVCSQEAKLPIDFRSFTNGDVLQAIFTDYDGKTGRVASILNDENKPALVRIDQAKPWRVGRQANLVVLVELAGIDEQFDEEYGLCGGCVAYAMLAVVKREGNRLALIAKQRAPASAVISDEEPTEDSKEVPFNPFDAVMFSGHDELSLDLAPFRLNSKETLIGLRSDHSWMGDRSTNLSLYRIKGAELKEVFSEFVVDWEYPNKNKSIGSLVLKTVSVISTPTATTGYRPLLIRKTKYRCIDRDDDGDCGPHDGTILTLKSTRERWNFDGEKYKQAKLLNTRP